MSFHFNISFFNEFFGLIDSDAVLHDLLHGLGELLVHLTHLFIIFFYYLFEDVDELFSLVLKLFVDSSEFGISFFGNLPLRLRGPFFILLVNVQVASLQVNMTIFMHVRTM